MANCNLLAKGVLIRASHWLFTRLWSGPRCRDFEPLCANCAAWMEHDEIVHFLTETVDG